MSQPQQREVQRHASDVRYSFPAIDQFTHVEVGLRFRSTVATWHRLKELLPTEARIPWARTAKHPNHPHFWKVDATMDPQGRVEIPVEFVEIFDGFEGFVMVKVVSRLSAGYFCAPGLGGRAKKLYGFDLVQARRGNGDFVFSMPFHRMAEGDSRFFFVLRLEEIEDTYFLTVQRVNISRGKTHFTLRLVHTDVVSRRFSNLAIAFDAANKWPDLTDLPVTAFLHAVKTGTLEGVNWRAAVEADAKAEPGPAAPASGDCGSLIEPA